MHSTTTNRNKTVHVFVVALHISLEPFVVYDCLLRTPPCLCGSCRAIKGLISSSDFSSGAPSAPVDALSQASSVLVRSRWALPVTQSLQTRICEVVALLAFVENTHPSTVDGPGFFEKRPTPFYRCVFALTVHGGPFSLTIRHLERWVPKVRSLAPAFARMVK